MEALDVDEVIAQLLASEGFATVEEVAYVEPSEIASIEGFDEDTAEEIQTRARELPREDRGRARRQAQGARRRRRAREIAGVTTAMLVALGENDIKTLEDLAGCATDDLAGWTERKEKETVHHDGILAGFKLSRERVEKMILDARVKAGWIEEAALEPAEEPRPMRPWWKAADAADQPSDGAGAA